MSPKKPFKIFTKEEALAEITKLVKSFEEFHSHYLSVDFNETQTRIEFVNPFWRALNWDIDNEKNQSPYHTEVVHEAKQRQDEAVKFADYLFRREESRDFFYLETKKPSVNIKNDTNSALQLRNYGWQRSMKISILSNFENFAIYNCLQEPYDDDKATVGLIENQFYTYKDYLTKFDFFWEYFERTKVFSGSLEIFVRKNVKKGNFKTVDTAFLEKIEEWRRNLAISLLTRNPNIEEYEINFAVQQTIDRMLFLKIAEDRGIEPKNQLKKCAEKGNLYENIYELFYTADQRYNSGLFDFKKDVITKALKVDNKIIKTIIGDLYKKGGFNFSIIPVEILGSAYEQFLGKIITFDENKTAKIDFKPEVRKAGGVYYTPQYIVDYIVEHTVGKKIAELSLKEELDIIAEISKIKILDPSCGSGSFLLGAYRFLLNFYQNYYFKLKKEGKKVRELTKDDQLTTAVKKQILLNNIYGVDIDTQAVEVTKLSLLIKCLEGETIATVMEQNKLFKERVLPTLDNNVLDGNSLISHDFYENSLFLTPKERRKINTFDWYETEKGFATVFKEGGFDVIIGNPPYVDYRILTDAQAKYIQTKFISTAVPEKWNLYVPFIELGSKLLKKQGLFACIVPNSFLVANFGFQLRKLLLTSTQVQQVLDVSKLKVFGDVATYPILIFFQNEFQKENYIKIGYPKKIDAFHLPDFELIAQEKLNNSKTNYLISTSFSNEGISLIEKIEKNANPLKTFYTKFIWGTSISGFKSYKIKENEYKKLSKTDKLLYNKVIQTADIKKYAIVWKGEYIKNEIYSENGMKEFAKDKIVIARVTKKIQASFDKESYFLGKSSLLTGLKANPLFLLALINSQVTNYFYAIKFENTHMAGGYLRFDIPYLEQLPIPIIDFNDEKQKNLHDKIVKNVESILLLNQQLQTLKIDSDKKNTIQLIRHVDKEINKLVFSLFELSNTDIEIIKKQLGEE